VEESVKMEKVGGKL